LNCIFRLERGLLDPNTTGQVTVNCLPGEIALSGGFILETSPGMNIIAVTPTSANDISSISCLARNDTSVQTGVECMARCCTSQ
jgi:hypothetical protein